MQPSARGEGKHACKHWVPAERFRGGLKEARVGSALVAVSDMEYGGGTNLRLDVFLK